MAWYAYRARNPRGELITGILEGVDSNNIAELLRHTDLVPVSITQASDPRGAGPDLAGWLQQLREEKVRDLDVQLFSRQMYTLLKAGVPIMRGLAGLQESASKPAFARVVQDMRESLDAGRELSTAMQRHRDVFSGFYLSMVRVGEMTGRLEEVFLRLFEHLEFERDMGNRVRSALRYPMFVMLAMITAMMVINLFVIPAFAGVYAGFHAQLPAVTRLLMATSRLTVRYWPLMLLSAGAVVLVLRLWINTREGRYQWDRHKLRLPVFGKIILKGTLARFARSFSLASKSGVPVLQGLSVVALTVDNAYIAARIEQMRNGIERGESILRTAVATQVFTPMVLQMIAVGEETGALDTLMDEIAQMYEREVDYELKTLSAQIEPILIVALGGMVLVLALGVFLPIWDLSQVVLHQ